MNFQRPGKLKKNRNVYKLISDSIKGVHVPLPTELVKEICAITGESCMCVPRKKLFSSNFTEQPNLQCPESQFVSVEVYQAMKYRKTRMSSWIATGKEFRLLKRIDVRPLVLSGTGSDSWAGWVTTTYKKHGSTRAKLNYAGQAIWAFDEMLVDCANIKKVNGIYNQLVFYLKKGFGRASLETLNCPGFVIMEVGLKEWLELDCWAKPLYKSNLYKFLCYLLPSQDELKTEGWENPVKRKIIKKQKTRGENVAKTT